MRIFPRCLREYTSGWLRFSEQDFLLEETEGKSFLRESLTSPSPGAPVLSVSKCHRVWQVNQCGEVCAPRDWRAGGGSFTVSDVESWGRVSMEPSVSISASGPDPGSSWQGLLGSGPEGVPQVLPGLPPFLLPVCSPLGGSSCSDLDSLGKQLLSDWAQGLSPWGRVCVGPWHVQVPVRFCCTEVTCRTPPWWVWVWNLSRPLAVTEPGWDPRNPIISGWGTCVVHAGSMAGRCVHIAVDEMRWPSGDGDAPSMAPRPRQEMESAQQPHGKLGKGKRLSVSANMEPGVMKERKWWCLFQVVFFFFMNVVLCINFLWFKYL